MMCKTLLCFVLTITVCFAQNFNIEVKNSPQTGTLFMAPERIPLKAGGFFQAERGTIFVPENRSDPNSNIISLEIYRFNRSDKADPETPPIFYLHGGPSFGGLESQLERPGNFESRWQPMLDVSDVVIISQRGIGPSKPTTLIDQTMEPQPLDRPYDEEKAVRDFQEILRKEKEVWEATGMDLSGYTVLEMAADVNEVRQAFGYEKIVLWGGSFGSHWSMAVMRTYPEIVARAIMRGMEGPDHTYDHPGHYWNIFKRVAEEAEKAQEFEGLIPRGGLINAVKKMIKQASRNPFVVAVSDSSGTHNVLFDKNTMKRFADGYSGGLPGWPANIITMAGANFQEVAEIAVQRFKNNRRNIRTASYWMLDCGSGITARRLAEYEADPAQDIVGSTYWGYAAGCPVWHSDLGDDFRTNFESDIPTVIVHGTWDTSTPYENALELVPYFKNCKFITLERGPHGAIRAAMEVSEEFRKGIFHFAATGDMGQLPDDLEMPPTEWIIPESK